MAKETMNYDNLLQGEVLEVANVKVAANQTIKRGDLLECVVTETFPVSGASATATRTVSPTFAKPSGVADIKNIYAIAAEDVTTTTQTGEVVVYIAGAYSGDKVVFGGSTTAANNKNVLLAKGIILK